MANEPIEKYIKELIRLHKQGKLKSSTRKTIRFEYQVYLKKHGRTYAETQMHLIYKDAIDEIKAYEENTIRNQA